jgi:hypothetical protein
MMVYVVTYGVWGDRVVLDGVYTSKAIVADRIEAIRPMYGVPDVMNVTLDVQTHDQPTLGGD